MVLGIKTSDRHAVEIEKAVKSFNSKQNMDLQIFRAEMKTDRYEILQPPGPDFDENLVGVGPMAWFEVKYHNFSHIHNQLPPFSH